MQPDVLLSTAYLAPVQYYTKLYRYPQVWVEQYDHYVKQTYRNRCVIAAAGGPLALTVPVSVDHTGKTPLRDVRLSGHGNWRHLHWNALVSAYENSPYFAYYADDFRPFYEERRYEFLLDWNEALQQKVCELLDLQPCVERTTAYTAAGGADDFRESIHPKRPHTDDASFRPVPYYQVFSQRYGFLPNLSIVDLLFNMGPEGLLVLRDSIVSCP